jgi:hypothetical protein
MGWNTNIRSVNFGLTLPTPQTDSLVLFHFRIPLYSQFTLLQPPVRTRAGDDALDDRRHRVARARDPK